MLLKTKKNMKIIQKIGKEKNIKIIKKYLKSNNFYKKKYLIFKFS